jgi:hypothetical protein
MHRLLSRAERKSKRKCVINPALLRQLSWNQSIALTDVKLRRYSFSENPIKDSNPGEKAEWLKG